MSRTELFMFAVSSRDYHCIPCIWMVCLVSLRIPSRVRGKLYMFAVSSRDYHCHCLWMVGPGSFTDRNPSHLISRCPRASYLIIMIIMYIYHALIDDTHWSSRKLAIKLLYWGWSTVRRGKLPQCPLAFYFIVAPGIFHWALPLASYLIVAPGVLSHS